jgi:hypothetical protein
MAGVHGGQRSGIGQDRRQDAMTGSRVHDNQDRRWKSVRKLRHKGGKGLNATLRRADRDDSRHRFTPMTWD